MNSSPGAALTAEFTDDLAPHVLFHASFDVRNQDLDLQMADQTTYMQEPTVPFTAQKPLTSEICHCVLSYPPGCVDGGLSGKLWKLSRRNGGQLCTPRSPQHKIDSRPHTPSADLTRLDTFLETRPAARKPHSADKGRALRFPGTLGSESATNSTRPHAAWCEVISGLNTFCERSERL